MEMKRDISGWSIRFDPAQARDWRAAGIWRDRTTVADARRLAETRPDDICVSEGGVDLTFGDALARGERLAAALWDRGFRPGDVISFQIPNWLEAVAINLAAGLLGLVVNPIVSIYRVRELRTILADCRAKAILIPEVFRGHDHAEMLARIAPDLPDLDLVAVLRGTPRAGQQAFDDLLASTAPAPPWPTVPPQAIKMVLYTSGTTGRPKAVLHSHETVTRAFYVSFDAWDLAAGDRIIMPSPIGHVTGYCYGLEMPFNLHTHSILMERWDPDEAVRLIDAHEVRMTVGATPFLAELVEAAERARSRLPSLAIFACGGAAVPPSLIRRANARFANGMAFRVYGSSEAPMVTQGFFTKNRDEDLAADTDGRILDFEVRIVDDAGCDVALGSEGEIVVRGPALTCGYADTDQTAEAFDEDGFFRTGDVGYRTADDGVVITGRKKDIIIRGGENLSAKEIEDALHRFPGIQEAAAVSMPHRRLGETVCAVAILGGGAKAALSDVVDFLKAEGIARQKFPEHLEIVTDMPRTASGKIRKDLLRVMIAEKVENGEIAP